MSTAWQVYNFIAPVGAVLGYLGLMVWSDRRLSANRRERAPTDEKLLRPAGYSLSQKLDDIRTDSTIDFAFAATCSGAIGMLLALPLPLQTSAGWAIGIGFVMIWTLVSSTRKLAIARAYSLGLKGELLVAQLLSEMIEHGYRVFHDYPGGDRWNIDHVVVGPGGVFALETKMRKKRKPIKGRPEFKVFLEKDRLVFGWCDDVKAVPQARRNAAALSNYLTSATGEQTNVTAVVAIPGWWVEARTRSDVVVLSGRALPGYFRSLPQILSASQIQRIAHQVEQKCRDVEI